MPLPPAGGEAQGGLVAVLLAHGGVGVAEGAHLGVADDEGWQALLLAVALGHVMLLVEGVVAVIGDGVEVEVEGLATGQAESVGGADPAAGEPGQLAGVDAAAVLAEGGALRGDVEAGEEGEALVEDMGHDVGMAGDAPELEGKQRAVGEQGVEIEAGEQGQEEQEAAAGSAEAPGGEVEQLADGGGGVGGADGLLELLGGVAGNGIRIGAL